MDVDEQPAFDAARLRERAAHCRRLAGDALSFGIARELELIALEYEHGADKLELGLS